jgi:phenylalanyl-tRNA synthetase beta chain
MKISFKLLKQFIDIDNKAEEVSEILTNLGLEVEGVETFESVKGGLKGVVLGEVLTCDKHPDADKLKLTTVNIGSEILQIVCGAPNVGVGQKVAVATIGTILFSENGENFTIKKGKIRGQESHGMLCSEKELGLGESNDGIMTIETQKSVGTPLSEVFDLANDEVFEIGLTPNRADAMSHLGVARDLKAYFNVHESALKINTPSISKYQVEKRTLKIDVDIANNERCYRYCGITISGVSVKSSPDWLKNYLLALGITPKNNIVDATNFVMHELGQPLHAFDAAKIRGKITVKTCAKDTPFTTLDDVERKLHEEDLMICDDQEPLCIAGVLGGKDSGITQDTINVFLESAYFDPVSIRKSSKRHGIHTDASFRFERGIDINLTDFALKRAAVLIKEIAGGDLSSDLIDIYPKKIEDFSLLLNLQKVDEIIGEEIPRETIKKILTALEIKVNSVSDTALGIIVPSYRVDVQREVDVIEEILRVYGYNKIQFSKKVNATLINSSRTEDYRLQNIIANQLNSLGFHEIMNNSLTKSSYSDLVSSFEKHEAVNILNPLSNDLSQMRQTLLFSGLEVIAHNINRKNNRLKIFEFGKSYHKKLYGFEEQKHLTLFQTGNKKAEQWQMKEEKVDFFHFKGHIEAILTRLNIVPTSFKPVQNDIFSEGLVFMKGETECLTLGLVNQKLLKQFDIKQDVFYADFNWQFVLKHISTKIKFKEIVKYPEVRRDLSLLIDNEISFDELKKMAFQTDKNSLKTVNLFDVYTGSNLPEGKKSYAMSFIIQDENQTLTDDKTDQIMNKIIEKYQSAFDAKLR